MLVDLANKLARTKQRTSQSLHSEAILSCIPTQPAKMPLPAYFFSAAENAHNGGPCVAFAIYGAHTIYRLNAETAVGRNCTKGDFVPKWQEAVSTMRKHDRVSLWLRLFCVVPKSA